MGIGNSFTFGNHCLKQCFIGATWVLTKSCRCFLNRFPPFVVADSFWSAGHGSSTGTGASEWPLPRTAADLSLHPPAQLCKIAGGIQRRHTSGRIGIWAKEDLAFLNRRCRWFRDGVVVGHRKSRWGYQTKLHFYLFSFTLYTEQNS